MQKPASSSSFYIRNAKFDFTFIMGGAIFTLLLAFVSFKTPKLLPIYFWLWVVLFEGSHFWATFSRTYIDRKYRLENKKVLLGSLVFFAFPALAIYFERLNPGVSYTGIYGFYIFVWSLYHNAKQHFGFLSIYAGKAKIDEETKGQMTKALYFAVVFAQIYFLFNFKIQLAFGVESTSVWPQELQFLVNSLPQLLSLGALAFFAVTAVQAWKKYKEKANLCLAYIATCLIFYPTMFYWIAPADTFYQASNGLEALLLIAIMNSLFHNIQYHAIVWHYGQSRYTKEETGFGVAKWINYRTLNYLVTAVSIGAVFGAIVWFVGDAPMYDGSFVQSKAHQWAYILFFGIIGHHFYLDQKIWRPSKQKDLKSYLYSQK